MWVRAPGGACADRRRAGPGRPGVQRQGLGRGLRALGPGWHRRACLSPCLTRTTMRRAHGREQPARGPRRPMTSGPRVCASHRADRRHLGPVTPPRPTPTGTHARPDTWEGRPRCARVLPWLAKNLTALAPAPYAAHLRSRGHVSLGRKSLSCNCHGLVTLSKAQKIHLMLPAHGRYLSRVRGLYIV